MKLECTNELALPSDLLEVILASTTSSELSENARIVASKFSENRYSSYCPVCWDYWHFGRHAEFAEELEMPVLALLLRAAWSFDTVLRYFETPKGLEAEKTKLREKVLHALSNVNEVEHA